MGRVLRPVATVVIALALAHSPSRPPVVVIVNPPREPGKKLALGRSVRKSDGATLRIPWDREEIRNAPRDEDASKR